MTTIALFGATGKTGRHVRAQALRSGYRLRVLARQPTAILEHSPLLEVIEGDVLDPRAVDEVIAGSDLVISVFGQVTGSPATLQTDGTSNIVTAMRAHDISRIVSLSGGGLPYAKDEPKVVDRIIRLLLRILAPKVLDDAKGHAEILRASGLDWTVVRAPVLTDAPATGEYRVGWVGVNASAKIGRADLADFIVRQAEDTTFVHQMPFVSY